MEPAKNLVTRYVRVLLQGDANDNSDGNSCDDGSFHDCGNVDNYGASDDVDDAMAMPDRARFGRGACPGDHDGMLEIIARRQRRKMVVKSPQKKAIA